MGLGTRVKVKPGILVAVAVVGLLLAAGFSVFVAPTGSVSLAERSPTPSIGHGAGSLVARPALARPSQPASTLLGGAERTLVLYNQTRFDYNASTIAGTIGEDPGLAFDTRNDTGWATGLSSVGASTVDVFDPTTDLGVRRMAAGGQSAIAYDNRTDTMWVTGGDTSYNVTVFNATTYAVEKVIPTGNDPRAITYDWRTREMYIVDFGTDNVTIIKDSNYAVASLSPEVGGYADGIAFDPGTGDLFVSHQLGQNVTVFYQTGNGAHANIAIPGAGEMGTILDDPQNGMVYASGDSPGVVIIDAATNATVGTIALPHSTVYAYDGLALDTADQRLYVSQIAGGGYGNVVSYQPAPTASTAQSLTNTSTGFNSQPETLVYDPTDALVLVCDTNQYNEASSNITEVSTASGLLVGSVGIQRLPLGSVYDPVTQAIYVYDGGTGKVYEIGSTDQVERSAFAGYTDPDTSAGVGISGQVAFDSVNNTIFVDWYTPDAPYGEGVAEFSASTLAFLRNWTTGLSAPSGIAYDAQDHAVYVADFYGDSATVISTTNWTEHSVGAGEAPIGVTYDPQNDGIYVVNDYDDNVTVIDGATGATQANVNTPVDSSPWGDVFDPANGDVYVADYDGGKLTVIDGATNTTAAVPEISLAGTINGPTWLTYDSVNETIIAALPGTTPEYSGYSGIALVNATNSTFFGDLEYGTQIWGVVYDAGAQTLFALATFPGAIYQVYFGSGASSSPPPLTTTLDADPSTIALGQSTGFVATPSGGTLPYSYAYSTLPTGCTSLNETPLPCTPTVAGTFYVGVNVTDPTAGHAAAVAVLTVTPTAATLQVTLTPMPASIVVGSSLDLVTSVSGGTGTGSYTFAYSTLPAGQCSDQNESTLPCVPSNPGTFYVGVNVTDADGNHGAASTHFTVTAPATTITATLTADPTSVTLGNATTLTVAIQGTPTGPLTYDYTVLPTGCSGANRSSVVCTPTAVGTYPMTVEVHDSAGHFAEANASLTVTSASAPKANNSGSSSWIWILIAVVVVVAILLIVLLARRRKKGEPATAGVGAPAPDAPSESPAGAPPPPP